MTCLVRFSGIEATWDPVPRAAAETARSCGLEGI